MSKFYLFFLFCVLNAPSIVKTSHSPTRQLTQLGQPVESMEQYLGEPSRRRPRFELPAAVSSVVQKRPPLGSGYRNLTEEQINSAKAVFFSQHKSLIHKFKKIFKAGEDKRPYLSNQSCDSVEVFFEGDDICVLYLCFIKDGNRLNLKKSYTIKQLQEWGNLDDSDFKGDASLGVNVAMALLNIHRERQS